MKRKLLIPERITLRWELVPGLGSKEIRQILIGAFLGLIVAVAASIAPGFTRARRAIVILAFLGWMGLLYAVFVRLDGFESIWTFLVRRYRFQRSQKKYHYKYEKEVLTIADECPGQES